MAGAAKKRKPQAPLPDSGGRVPVHRYKWSNARELEQSKCDTEKQSSTETKHESDQNDGDKIQQHEAVEVNDSKPAKQNTSVVTPKKKVDSKKDAAQATILGAAGKGISGSISEENDFEGDESDFEGDDWVWV